MADTVAERDYRRAWVVVSEQALLGALPVPKDARLIEVRRDVNSSLVELLLESAEYEVVPEGGVVPRVAGTDAVPESEPEEESDGDA